MKRIITIAAMTAILSTGAMAQTFFSLSAGNSSINVNVTNGMGQWPMYYEPYYGPVVPNYPSKKAVKKARKRARKAARDYNGAVGNFWYPFMSLAYYYDDDDVEDYYKHRAKMYKKHQKRAQKAYKHSKKRHKRHDDDDD